MDFVGHLTGLRLLNLTWVPSVSPLSFLAPLRGLTALSLAFTFASEAHLRRRGPCPPLRLPHVLSSCFLQAVCSRRRALRMWLCDSSTVTLRDSACGVSVACAMDKLDIVKLGADNYVLWSAHCNAVLTTKSLRYVLFPADEDPDAGAQGQAAIAEAAAKRQADDAKAKAFMILSVGPQHVGTVNRAASAANAWATLKSVYAAQSTARQMQLLLELNLLGSALRGIHTLQRGPRVRSRRGPVHSPHMLGSNRQDHKRLGLGVIGLALCSCLGNRGLTLSTGIRILIAAAPCARAPSAVNAWMGRGVAPARPPGGRGVRRDSRRRLLHCCGSNGLLEVTGARLALPRPLARSASVRLGLAAEAV